MLKPEDIEEIRRYFNSSPETGTKLPDARTVRSNTSFYLKASDTVYEEYIMFNGSWHKKVVDSNSNVTLEKV